MRLRPKERSNAACRGRPITRDPIEVDSASFLYHKMGLEHAPAPPQHDHCVDELQVGQIDNLIIRTVFGEYADEFSANRMFVEGKSSDKV